MDIGLGGFTLGFPVPAGGAEVPDQFFFFVSTLITGSPVTPNAVA